MFKSFSRFTSTVAACGILLSALTVVPAIKADAKPFRIKMGQIGHLENHVFLTGGIVATDVTSTMYTSGGLTYCVYNGATLQIVVNYTNQTVKNAAGSLIGYTALVQVGG